jgi:DNA polymerase-3 subunit delta'
MKWRAVGGGDPKPVGVNANGELPLPWLRDALAQAQRLTRSHALLLHAGVPNGQFELALTLAQGWLCEHPDRAPCGRCTSCRHARQRTHPDMRVVVPEAMRVEFDWLTDDDPLLRAGVKPSREIKVEQVREAIEWSQRSAGSERGRALVLYPAQALNMAAANALLKTLEEPPGALRIAMAGGDPELLLPTIRSRVQRLALKSPDAATALAWLKAQGVVDVARALAVAGGSPLAAQALIEAGVGEADLQVLPRAVARGDAQGLIGKPLPLVIDLLLRIAHDAMAHAAGAAPRFFDAAQMPPAAPLSALQSWRQELLRAARHDEHPWNASLLVEALVTNGARCWASARQPTQRGTGRSIHSAG